MLFRIFVLMEMNENYIAVGRVGRPHGLEGWVRFLPYSGDPARLQQVKVLYRETVRGMQGVIISGQEVRDGKLFLKLHGLDTREDVEALVGQEMWLPEEQKIELPEDTYFVHELIGMDVVDESGSSLGRLTDVLEMSANDIYVVNDGGRERLIPAVGEFIKQVDLQNRRMVVRLWDGM